MCYVLVPGADGLQSTGAPAAVVRKGAALCWYCKLRFHGIYYQAFDRKEIQQLVNCTVPSTSKPCVHSACSVHLIAN